MGNQREYRFGVLGGDGVGPSVVNSALEVLAAVAEREGFTFETVDYPYGAEHYLSTGDLPDEQVVREIGDLDGLLFGALGDPRVKSDDLQRGIMFRLVNDLKLNVGIRPATLYAPRLCPLREVPSQGIDVVLVREQMEDCFLTDGFIIAEGEANEVSVGNMVYSRSAVERTVRYAFQLADSRRRRLALVAQVPLLRAQIIWLRVCEEVASEFPDVQLTVMQPDVAGMVMVTGPGELDVVVTPRWLGGILTNVIGAMIGGIGLMASARVNTETGFGLYEPAHGSAPKYAGQDRVSPGGAVRALAMLLAAVGEDDASVRVVAGLRTAFESGAVPDASARGIGTRAATEAIVSAVRDLPVGTVT